jgi:hypothetical protein
MSHFDIKLIKSQHVIATERFLLFINNLVLSLVLLELSKSERDLTTMAVLARLS